MNNCKDPGDTPIYLTVKTIKENLIRLFAYESGNLWTHHHIEDFAMVNWEGGVCYLDTKQPLTPQFAMNICSRSEAVQNFFRYQEMYVQYDVDAYYVSYNDDTVKAVTVTEDMDLDLSDVTGSMNAALRTSIDSWKKGVNDSVFKLSGTLFVCMYTHGIKSCDIITEARKILIELIAAGTITTDFSNPNLLNELLTILSDKLLTTYGFSRPKDIPEFDITSKDQLLELIIHSIDSTLDSKEVSRYIKFFLLDLDEDGIFLLKYVKQLVRHYNNKNTPIPSSFYDQIMPIIEDVNDLGVEFTMKALDLLIKSLGGRGFTLNDIKGVNLTNLFDNPKIRSNVYKYDALKLIVSNWYEKGPNRPAVRSDALKTGNTWKAVDVDSSTISIMDNVGTIVVTIIMTLVTCAFLTYMRNEHQHLDPQDVLNPDKRRNDIIRCFRNLKIVTPFTYDLSNNQNIRISPMDFYIMLDDIGLVAERNTRVSIELRDRIRDSVLQGYHHTVYWTQNWTPMTKFYIGIRLLDALHPYSDPHVVVIQVHEYIEHSDAVDSFYEFIEQFDTIRREGIDNPIYRMRQLDELNLRRVISSGIRARRNIIEVLWNAWILNN
jgi:hypothetical protein